MIFPLVIAHRGASGYRPEHTRAAYDLAIAQGADAIEPDLVVTRDGVLVIRHENEISGTTDVASRSNFADRRTSKVIDGELLTGWFTEDFSWAELSGLEANERVLDIRPANGAFGGAILRLIDLLEILDAAPVRPDGTRVGLVAEIKHASYFSSIGFELDLLFAEALTAAGWADDDRVTIESFEKSVLLKVRERGIRGRLVFLLEAEGAPADAVETLYRSFLSPAALRELAGEVDGISVDKQMLEAHGAALVDAAHAAGLTVFCWTLRAENHFLAPGLRSTASAAPSAGGTAAAIADPSALGNWMTEFTDLMRLGLDGVFADQPDLAIRARAALQTSAGRPS